MKGFLEMDEYNFVPNYVAWWKKRDLSKNQMVYLMLGLNPDDAVRYEGIQNKPNRSDDENSWLSKFDIYCYNLDRDLNNHHKHSLLLLKSETKDKIFQEAYENSFKINKTFYDFLVKNKSIKESKDLEAYKDHTMFEIKDDDIGRVCPINGNYHIARILNVNGAYFDRFINLDDKNASEPFDQNDFCAYDRFTPDEKWFYNEYGDFLREYYGVSFSDLTGQIRNIKPYVLFCDDFNQYCQKLHDEGFIFKDKTYKHLKKIGVSLKYSQEGWACKFYVDWVKKKPLWTAQDAAKLYLGISLANERGFFGFPEFQVGESGYGLGHFSAIYFFNENGEWEDAKIKNFIKETSLIDFVKRHDVLGNIRVAYRDGDSLEFKPKEIVQFLRKYCPNTHQPKALFQALGIGTNEENIKNTESVEYEFAAISKSDREIIVLNYALKLWEENDQPRVGWVHKKIIDNPGFIIGKKKWPTVLKPITEKKLSQESQSRKIAENRGKNTI